jgi:uncharacterized protein
MRIVIAGGTGFIGKALTHYFLKKNADVIIIGRDKRKIQSLFSSQVTSVNWNEFSEEGKDLLLTSDLVINLAGTNIASKRWNIKRKRDLIDSRVSTTKMLAEACAALGKNSPPLFNASALSIYGLQKNIDHLHPCKEDNPINYSEYPDFASEITKKWEKATEPAKREGVRVVNMRFALVLGKGGLLTKLYLPYQLGLGGIIGPGDQPFPWIALFDLLQAVDFLFHHSDIEGPVNFVAPECISQAQFAKAFAKTIHRPCFLRIPPSFLRTFLGEMADVLLLNGQCVYPQILLNNKFQFQYPDIKHALEAIFTVAHPG